MGISNSADTGSTDVGRPRTASLFRAGSGELTGLLGNEASAERMILYASF
jgi:hypothetical protein